LGTWRPRERQQLSRSAYYAAIVVVQLGEQMVCQGEPLLLATDCLKRSKYGLVDMTSEYVWLIRFVDLLKDLDEIVLLVQ
jgi:hypothetical protein